MPMRIKPCLKLCTHYQMNLLGKKVGIDTNCPELPLVFLDSNCITSCDGNLSEDYKITALLSMAINSNFTSDDIVISESDDGDDIFMNEVYLTGGNQTTFITYPNNTIIHETADCSSTYIITGNKDVLVYYLKKAIKKIASEIFVQSGYIAIHAGAIVSGHKCYILLGDSYAGKSTLCYNLYTQGYQYINDDIVFLKKESTQWIVKSLMIYPNLRECAFDYLSNKEIPCESIHSEYQKSFSIRSIQFSSEDVFVEKMFYIGSIQSGTSYILDPIKSVEIISRAVIEHGKIQHIQLIHNAIIELAHDIECVRCCNSDAYDYLIKQLKN